MKNFDNSFLTENIKLIAGVDEAGRGPVAGPVVAAAVIFDQKTFIPLVNDSKKLSENMRESLFPEILKKAISYGIGIVDNHSIDKINILQATLLAMKSAVDKLTVKPDLVLIDGNKVFKSGLPLLSIVKGDSKSFAIAAASILAKVTRDRIMKKKSNSHPEYLWYKNKGYATKEHIAAIRQFGYTNYHRKTFLNKILESGYIDDILDKTIEITN